MARERRDGALKIAGAASSLIVVSFRSNFVLRFLIFFYFTVSPQERVECRLLEGRERLSRVRRSAASTAEHTAAGGCEAMDRQLGALSQALEQWEGAALRARDGLEGALASTAASEEEYERLTGQLDDELKELDGRLRGWSQELVRAEGRSNGEEAVEGWQLAKV